MIIPCKSYLKIIYLGLLCPVLLKGQNELPGWYTTAQAHAQNQILATVGPLLNQFPYSGSGEIRVYPFETINDGSGGQEWKLDNWTRWGAGFFPGQLWQMSFVDSSEDWAPWAGLWSEPVFGWKTREDHDIGFNLLLSAGLGYDRTGDAAYRDVLLEGAETFSTSHWMEAVGSLWSFNFNNARTSYGRRVGGFRAFQNVIIDTTMNIGLLFRASREGGNPLWAERGLSHMRNSYRDLVREDGSTIQIVDYFLEDQIDSVSGEITAPAGSIRGLYGWQGYSENTTWSRGQAWAIHGFTTAYRETGDPLMLEAAEKVAKYWIDNVPEDHIPYWDFNALDSDLVPDAFYELLIEDSKLPTDFDRSTDNKRDSSAAAIAASGFMELAVLSVKREDYDAYMAEALGILESLSTPGKYLTIGMPYDSILAEGTYTFPGSEKGLSWGEYYYVEALERYRRLFDLDLIFSGEEGFNQRGDFVESDPTLWQIQWIQGKPRYVVTAAQDIGGGDQPFAFSLLSSNPSENYLFQLECAPTSNLGTAEEASIAVVLSFTDDQNYVYLHLSSLEDRGGIFQVKEGVVSLLEKMQPAFLDQFEFKSLTIALENGVLQVSDQDNVLLSAGVPGLLSVGSVGLGTISGGAAFSDLSLAPISELRTAQSIPSIPLDAVSIYDQPVETNTWVSDAGLPVQVEVIRGPVFLDTLGRLIPTGIGEVELRLSQAGNANFSPAAPLHLILNLVAGSLTFEEWAESKSLPSNPQEDTSGDGYSNLLSFALGLDPLARIEKSFFSAIPVQSNSSNSTVVLSYVHNNEANAYIRLQESVDGMKWRDLKDGEERVLSVERQGMENSDQVEVTLSIEEAEGGSALYRLIVDAL